MAMTMIQLDFQAPICSGDVLRDKSRTPGHIPRMRANKRMPGGKPAAGVNTETSYFSLPSVSLIAWKFGNSFGVGVCSLYWMTPFLSMTNAARALTAPNPIKSGNSVP